MIGFVRGTVDQVAAENCLVDVQGVGYRVFVPASTRDKLISGSEVKLYTYLNVREDALLLFGFASQEEHAMFLLLLGVSGVGPKMALAVLSAMRPEGIRIAISRNDLASLTRISGVGKKTAERMVLELKDKIGQLTAAETVAGLSADHCPSVAGPIFDEALAALSALGYNQGEVLPVLRKHSAEAATVEALVKLVLRDMIRR
jgi:Holliday junction DNA helicase RuvA